MSTVTNSLLRITLIFTLALGAAYWLGPRPARARVSNLGPEILDLRYAVNSGLLSRMLAKEMCSCRYVTGLPIAECLKRTSLPGPLVNSATVTDQVAAKSITAGPTVVSRLLLGGGPSAQARFRTEQPQLGCVITDGTN